jgi:catechol-2,3-dioxygenase
LSTNECFSFASTKHLFRNLKFRDMEALAAEPGSSSIKYGGIHHCGVLVSDLEKSKHFYMDVLGFSDDSHLRPKTLPYGGAFLRVGKDQIHLMQLPNPG